VAVDDFIKPNKVDRDSSEFNEHEQDAVEGQEHNGFAKEVFIIL